MPSNVANLYADLAKAYGNAAEARSNFWANAISNITGIPQEVYQQQQQQKLQAAREQRLTEQAEYQKQSMQLQIDAAKRKQEDDAATADVVKAMFPDPNKPPDVAAGIARANELGKGHLVPWIHQTAQAFQSKPIDVAAGGTLAVPDPTRPGMYTSAFTAPPKVEPGSVGEYVTQQRAAAKAAGQTEGPDDLLKWTREFHAASRPEAQSEWNMFANSYAGSLGKKTWEELTPQQQQGGFAKFAEVKADPAAERQARTIAAQVAQQSRQQSFAEKEAGRKVLTSDVEKPYQTAHSSADTLRDTVRAAQAGNKVAGSLQSLETTMTAIRAQGLNRINTAEIGMTGNAGSMLDRIQGWLGKATEGQPVPKEIQADMLQFADILDRAAYKKYRDQHATITKRYGLTDETPLPDPSGAVSPDTGNALTVTAPNGKTYTFKTAADADAFKKRAGMP